MEFQRRCTNYSTARVAFKLTNSTKESILKEQVGGMVVYWIAV
jgi:hypothetical protein